MSNAFRSHRDLKVWQLGVGFVTAIYELVENFPKKELYCLSDQLRRAAISVPSNIAEGHARNSTKEFLHFLSISVASLAEIDTQLEITRNLKYAQPRKLDELSANLEELSRMIHGLRRSLQTKLNNS